jgi:Methyltransferase domain
MLAESAHQIHRRLGEKATVLDVGGGARPFPRADWVIDLVAYQDRGQLGWDGDRSAERFGELSWVQRDICDRRPWPFADRQFDFSICSHTLEDVRDPIWVCSELQRVSASGYIEVPSLQEELTYGLHGPWVGWSHHRWLVLVEPPRIEFLFKHHVVNRSGSHLPAGSVDDLETEQRVQTLWWEDRFEPSERIMLTAKELDGFLERTANENRPAATAKRREAGRLRGMLRGVRRRV